MRQREQLRKQSADGFSFCLIFEIQLYSERKKTGVTVTSRISPVSVVMWLSAVLHWTFENKRIPKQYMLGREVQLSDLRCPLLAGRLSAGARWPRTRERRLPEPSLGPALLLPTGLPQNLGSTEPGGTNSLRRS